MGVRRWLKEQSLLRCARKLREYSANERKKEPNIHCFPRDTLREVLARQGDERVTDDVLEFMELKGWAGRVKHPPDCYWIN